MKEIILFATENGIQMQTKGFRGKTCLAEAEKIISMLKGVGIDMKTENVEITAEGREEVSVKLR